MKIQFMVPARMTRRRVAETLKVLLRPEESVGPFPHALGNEESDGWDLESTKAYQLFFATETQDGPLFMTVQCDDAHGSKLLEAITFFRNEHETRF